MGTVSDHGQGDTVDPPPRPDSPSQDGFYAVGISLLGTGVAEKEHSKLVRRLGTSQLASRETQRIALTGRLSPPEQRLVRDVRSELVRPRVPELDAGVVTEVQDSKADLGKDDQGVDGRDGEERFDRPTASMDRPDQGPADHCRPEQTQREQRGASSTLPEEERKKRP